MKNVTAVIARKWTEKKRDKKIKNKFNYILQEIESAAKDGNYHIVIELPEYMIEEDGFIVTTLINKGFTIKVRPVLERLCIFWNEKEGEEIK